MTESKTKSSRRAFFLSGGAVLGTGVAATASAASLISNNVISNNVTPENDQLKQLQQRLANLEDREAIRQLHLAFTSLIESQNYATATELFDEHAQLQLSSVSAKGKLAIRQQLADQVSNHKAGSVHSAYRHGTLQSQDAITLHDASLQATATFHVEVELSTPLQGDSTLVQMARLQGHVANRRWETGRFETEYVKTAGQWKITSLRYLSA